MFYGNGKLLVRTNFSVHLQRVQVDRQAKKQIKLSFLNPSKIYTGPQEEKKYVFQAFCLETWKLEIGTSSRKLCETKSSIYFPNVRLIVSLIFLIIF